MRYFEVWLLRLAGLFPDLSTCVECGRPLESIVEFDAEFRPYCGQCGRSGAASLSVSTLASVRAAFRLAPAKFAEMEKLSERDDASPAGNGREGSPGLMTTQTISIREQGPRRRLRGRRR